MNRPEPRKKKKYKSPYKKGGHRRIIKEENMAKQNQQNIKLDSKTIKKLLDEEPNLTIAEFKKRIGYKKNKK